MRKTVGSILTLAITLWYLDALLPHIQACSWTTLGVVVLMLVGQWADLISTWYVGSLAEAL